MRRELRILVELAIPIALAQVGVMTLGLVEVAVLGRTSPSDLGGASIGRSIAFVAASLGYGIASALEPLASQAVGAKDEAGAWGAYAATLRAGLLVAIPSTLVELLAAWLLPSFGIADSIVRPARMFLFAQVPSLALVGFYMASKVYLQAHNRTFPAIFGAVLANVVNIFFSWLFVLHLRLGAFGAGMTNTISSLVLAACVLVPAWRLRPRSGAGGPSVMKVIKLGIPIGSQFLAEIGVFSLVGVIAGRLGEVAVGAHQIAIALASTTFMAALGVSGATSVRVGVAIGEGRSARGPGSWGSGSGVAFMTFTALLFFGFPAFFVGLFTIDPATRAMAMQLLGIAALFQIFDGIQGVAAGALRGAGDVRFSFFVNVGAHWLIGFPLALFLGFSMGLGPTGLWWGLLTGLGVVAVLLAYRFHRISRHIIART